MSYLDACITVFKQGKGSNFSIALWEVLQSPMSDISFGSISIFSVLVLAKSATPEATSDDLEQPREYSGSTIGGAQCVKMVKYCAKSRI